LILPELAACRGIEQRGLHRFDVLDHSLCALDWAAAEEAPLSVRLAALFHDLGKVSTRRFDEGLGRWTFYGHEVESEKLCRQVMTRLRWPNAVIDEVCLLVAEHMFHYEESWSNAAVRRFVAKAGEANLDGLFALRRADGLGMTQAPPPPGDDGLVRAGPALAAANEALLPFIGRIEAVLAAARVLGLRDLAVNGRDLIAAGIPPGKRLGIILRELLDAVQGDPGLNTREQLLEMALALSQRWP